MIKSNKFYFNLMNKYNGLLKVIYNTFCMDGKIIKEFEKVANAIEYIKGARI